ncbi:hypothetical protein ACGFIF_17120 [Kribbella sp. NPDC049174]|uniref:hypothetical protein n=1 Tax=Kribbella sp. NPDC049174 TaxID=3364112 RepID=UPI003711DD80
MDEVGVLEAARAMRPYMTQLVGPTLGRDLDRQIAILLNSDVKEDERARALVSLMRSNETTEDFLTEVLADAPDYRPPSLQPAELLRGGADYRALAGDTEPVLHVGKYICVSGDYVWYRPAVGTRIPACPTHASALVRN